MKMKTCEKKNYFNSFSLKKVVLLKIYYLHIRNQFFQKLDLGLNIVYNQTQLLLCFV